MSHFTVMVFGENPEKQLLPFQENTRSKEFFEFVDKEDEMKRKYENEGSERVIMPDGRKLLTWDHEFRVKGTYGMGSGTHKVPEYLKIEEIPFKELFSSFDEYAKEWCGYDSRDAEKGRYGYWSNPNSKWDWYQLGGRWRGFFRLKEKKYLPPIAGEIMGDSGLTRGEIEALATLQKESVMKYYSILKKYQGKTEEVDKVVKQFSLNNPHPQFVSGIVGEDGVFNKDKDVLGYADQVKKANIDYEYMKLKAEASARETYQKIALLFEGGSIPTIRKWKDCCEEGTRIGRSIKDTITCYVEQPAVKIFNENKEKLNLGFFPSLDDFQMTEEEYAEQEALNSIVPFAVIRDGKWFEKGTMGWWGMVSDEKDEKVWIKEFWKMFKELPDDTLISVFDCHI